MAAYPGKSLSDAQVRKAYLLAQQFVADTTGTTPDVTGKEALNDMLVYLLEHYKTMYDLIVVGSIVYSGVILQPQVIEADITIPVGFNGFTISNELDDGYTVTIEEGASLYHGGAEDIDN